MQSKQQIQEEEERIRLLIRQLPDSERELYYKTVNPLLKDPDTYATLNYVFIAGLHHFYLKNWTMGIINIVVFWFGIGMFILGYPIAGGIAVLGISCVELYELFRSQAIVQDYNNKVMEQALAQRMTIVPIDTIGMG
jgi:TM2 domain-containing membrane protein YozV